MRLKADQIGKLRHARMLIISRFAGKHSFTFVHQFLPVTQEEGFMMRVLLIAAATLVTLGIFLVDEVFDSERSPPWQRTSRQMSLAADPSLKFVPEDSPYMRSER